MILDDMNIEYKRQGVGYYVVGKGKEIFIDVDAIYFLYPHEIRRKSLSQKTIKRQIREYLKTSK